MSGAYEAAAAALNAARAGLAEHLPKTVGHVVGVEFSSHSQTLSATRATTVEEAQPSLPGFQSYSVSYSYRICLCLSRRPGHDNCSHHWPAEPAGLTCAALAACLHQQNPATRRPDLVCPWYADRKGQAVRTASSGHGAGTYSRGRARGAFEGKKRAPGRVVRDK